jgi:ribose transport system permease protein
VTSGLNRPGPDAAIPLERLASADRAPDTRGGAARLGSEAWTAIALFVLTALLIVGSRWVSPGLGGWSQAKAMLLLSSFGMVLAFGQQMVILIGGLDLSVASVMTLGGVLVFGWNDGSAASLIWSIPAALIATFLVGAANGIGVTLLRVPPFIMTLATGIIVYGAILGITGGTPRGHASPVLSGLFTQGALGIPYVIYLMLAFAVLGSVLQTRTPFGRKLYAVGTSPEAGYIAGLPVARLTVATYAISGAAAGLAGVLMTGYAGGATLTMGQSYLLPSIASVVVGGTSIFGGRGTYPGAVGGTVLLTTLSTIISSLGIAEGWRTVIYGFVILLALLLLREELLAWTERWRPHAGNGTPFARSGDPLRGNDAES